MSAGDKISNKATDLKGKAKETQGKITGNEEKEAEGKMDQVKADIKDGVEKIKDAFKH